MRNVGINSVTGNNTNTVGLAGTNISIYFQQLLFDFHHTRELVRQAVALTYEAQANCTKAQSDLILQVKQAFYQYVQNLRLVTVNEENVANNQQHFAMTEASVLAGTGVPSDMVTAQTSLVQAMYALSQARNTAITSRVLLAQLMGIDPRTPIQPANSVEPEIQFNNMNDLVTQALCWRPEIRRQSMRSSPRCMRSKRPKHQIIRRSTGPRART